MAAAVLAGSALAFSSFAVVVPAALADEEATPAIATVKPEASSQDSSETPTAPDDETSVKDSGSAETGDLGEEVEPTEPVTEEPTSSETSAEPSPETQSRFQTQQDDGDDGDGGEDNTEPDDAELGELRFAVSPRSGPSGTQIDLSGSGFTPGGDIDVKIVTSDDPDATPINYDTFADDEGVLDDVMSVEGAPGLYHVTATDVDTGRYEVETFNITDVTMDINPETLSEEEFRDNGVTLTIRELEPNQVVDVAVSNRYNPIDELSGTATAGGDGVATYSIQGAEDLRDIYVGAYSVIVTESGSEVQLAEGSFDVTSENPQVSVHSPDANDDGSIPQGGTLHVTGNNATPNSDVTVDFGLEGVEAQIVESTSDGEYGAEITIPENAQPSEKTVTVTDDETGTVGTAEYTVAEAAEDVEPTLTADRTQITLDEFVGSDDGESGVGFLVEGLEPNTDFTYMATASGPVADLEATETTDADGTARFSVYGDEKASDPSVYLGRYSVTVVYKDEAGEPQELGPVHFRVVDEITEDIEIELESDEVYQGESLDVEIWNLTPEGNVEIEWNPTETLTADDDGEIDTDLPIADDADTGVQTLTVTDLTTERTASVEYTVLDASDQVVDPSLTIDPERIELDDFIGDPEDGAGVAHTVQGLEPGTEISYAVTGPEYVSDFESTAPVEEDGVASFVIYGYDVANPSVYLGEYNTVVTYVDEDGEAQTLSGSFTVVDGDDSTGGTGGSDDDRGSTGPVDLNGASGLAQTGANGIQFGMLAGGLLLAGGALLAFANRKRLFGRTA
ncbi:hypothetical protein GCM10022249_02520 [Enteractinococcus coprophilus]